VRNLRSDELRNLRGINYITHFKECQSAEFTKYLRVNVTNFQPDREIAKKRKI